MNLPIITAPRPRLSETPAVVRAREVVAFTLIELLVTIAIIGIVASLVLSGVQIAARKRDESQVRAELSQYILLIETYKDKYGRYPPDNPAGPVTNSLYYELSGTTAVAGNFQTLDGSQSIAPADAQAYLGVPGFLNTTIGAVSAKNYLPALKSQQAMLISTAPAVMVLTGPGKPAPNNTIIINGQPVNPWRYNYSTPVHNPGRYDLWLEININNQTNIIGNWKN